MLVKFLSGEICSLTANSMREAKEELGFILETSPYFLTLLHPDTGEELQHIQEKCVLINRFLPGEEFDHYPRLFTRIDGFAYPIDSPEVFREKIEGVDVIVLNESVMYQLVSVFKYMCDHLHPYAYEDYFPMLSYYHIDTDQPEELLEWSLQNKVINAPHLNLTQVDIEFIKAKVFHEDEVKNDHQAF